MFLNPTSFFDSIFQIETLLRMFSDSGSTDDAVLELGFRYELINVKSGETSKKVFWSIIKKLCCKFLKEFSRSVRLLYHTKAIVSVWTFIRWTYDISLRVY